MKRTLLAGLALLAAATLNAPTAHSNARNAKYIPNLPVVTQDGKTLHFYDDLIKDKIVVISFVYTTCADLCPITTARLAEVKEKLGDAMGRDIHFISLTVDPEHDTPEMLKAFAEAFDAGPNWTFVTGKPADMRAILEKFGDKSGERGLNEHRNEILIGNDVVGDWQRDNAFGDVDRLAMTIHSMDPKWVREVRQPEYSEASDKGLVLDTQPGAAMFKKICAPCHTIGAGDKVGPDLRGVTERRERAWLVEFIKNPAKLLAQKDETALAIAEGYPAVRMPRLGLTDNDAADMLAYFDKETARLDALDQHAAADQKTPGKN